MIVAGFRAAARVDAIVNIRPQLAAVSCLRRLWPRRAQALMHWDILRDIRCNRVALICQFQKLTAQNFVVR
jgi:hypothetical protein